MDQQKKIEENNLIEDILKEGEDLGEDVDVDIAGIDVEAILNDANIDMGAITPKVDDITSSELLDGISVAVNKTQNNDNLLRDIMKEINTEIISKKKETKKKLPKFDDFFSLINFLEKKKLR